MTANLFTKNDLAQLRTALASGQEIRLVRTLGPVTMSASTCPAVPVHGCGMLVRLEQAHGCVYISQYFHSVEEMVEYL